MGMVAYEGLRPTLSSNCLKSIRSLFTKCTSDKADSRPSFEEIVDYLDQIVRKEVLASKVRHLLRRLALEKRNTYFDPNLASQLRGRATDGRYVARGFRG